MTKAIKEPRNVIVFVKRKGSDFGDYNTQVVLLRTHWGCYDYKITPWCYFNYVGNMASEFNTTHRLNTDIYKKIKKMAQAYCDIHEDFEVVVKPAEIAIPELIAHQEKRDGGAS